jgi:hypothetical protein
MYFSETMEHLQFLLVDLGGVLKVTNRFGWFNDLCILYRISILAVWTVAASFIAFM